MVDNGAKCPEAGQDEVTRDKALLVKATQAQATAQQKLNGLWPTPPLMFFPFFLRSPATVLPLLLLLMLLLLLLLLLRQ